VEFEDYKTIGKWLKTSRILLITDLVKNKYPKTSKLARKREQAYKLLMKLTSCLNDLLFKEHGEKPTEKLINVFYGRLMEEVPQRE